MLEAHGLPSPEGDPLLHQQGEPLVVSVWSLARVRLAAQGLSPVRGLRFSPPGTTGTRQTRDGEGCSAPEPLVLEREVKAWA